MYVDVPDPRNPNRLLFRFDPERDIIQIQERGQKHTIDLAELRQLWAKARELAPQTIEERKANES